MPTRDFTPERVHRRNLLLARTPWHKVCTDDRAYTQVPFTIPGDVATGDYAPMWPAPRDFYIASITATIGKHDSGTHPADGCPTGAALKCNVRRVTTDLTGDAAVLASDSTLDIAADTHRDTAVNAAGLYNVSTLLAGEFLYVRVSQVGSTTPGSNLVVSVELVPVRL